MISRRMSGEWQRAREPQAADRVTSGIETARARERGEGVGVGERERGAFDKQTDEWSPLLLFLLLPRTVV